jgi:homoserine O-succinyltransferase
LTAAAPNSRTSVEIAIINLMADKISTERQLALCLGNTMLQVNLTFVATDSYVSGVRSAPPARIWRRICD